MIWMKAVMDVPVIEILVCLHCDWLLCGYIREDEMKSLPAPVGRDEYLWPWLALLEGFSKILQSIQTTEGLQRMILVLDDG